MEVALTFGSLGDIIAICQVAVQLRRAIGVGSEVVGESAKEYQDFREDLDTFVCILMQIVATYQQHEFSSSSSSSITLVLKEKCLGTVTGKPYILSSRGGRDNSVEGRNNGITHAFVVEFANKEDRDYYTFKEPAHLEFIASLDGIASQVTVIDFSDNQF
ncbi:Stress-response A/B barrel domain-containing protein [Fusarium falciforme]|uniref:Stress-response A/B barrel domain-containing protein n=1 Tax=Fusarium falciforme TaxID=195108 RepID=UPI002301377F|nr:Stress-response A/B barrel domain-containing protein [Fusarium falciforme]WAO95610.1 Stress-response A/B barrel domain-containing protein [Fusarium falciforme]